MLIEYICFKITRYIDTDFIYKEVSSLVIVLNGCENGTKVGSPWMNLYFTFTTITLITLLKVMILVVLAIEHFQWDLRFL